jgi:hypothetical protein
MRNQLLICALSSILVHYSTYAASAAIFPDKNLEAAVRWLILEKRNDPTKELTEEDLKKIFLLEAKGKGIKDLTGLEKCVNLQLLDLARNEIVDIGQVKGLTNLQSLDLSQNKIADIAPLAELKGLQYLELSKNEIANLAPLTVASAEKGRNKRTFNMPIFSRSPITHGPLS